MLIKFNMSNVNLCYLLNTTNFINKYLRIKSISCKKLIAFSAFKQFYIKLNCFFKENILGKSLFRKNMNYKA